MKKPLTSLHRNGFQVNLQNQAMNWNLHKLLKRKILESALQRDQTFPLLEFSESIFWILRLSIGSHPDVSQMLLSTHIRNKTTVLVLCNAQNIHAEYFSVSPRIIFSFE